jgi:uncharacterized protein YyaL (SSP411 family)
VEIYDGAIPSGNSVAANNLLKLAHLTGRMAYAERAQGILDTFAGKVAGIPSGHTQFLHALDFALGPAAEVVVVGDAGEAGVIALRRALHAPFLPRTVSVLKDTAGDGGALADLVPYTQAMNALDGQPTAYVCRGFACEAPTADAAIMLKNLGVE